MRVKEESEKAGLRSWHPVSSLHGKQKWKRWKQSQILFSWAPKSLQTITAAMTFKDTCSLSESYDKPRQHIKKQRDHFANKDASNQSYSFSRNHVWMWELDHKQGWAPKNWCFQIVVLEKTLASPLEISQESKPVHPKVNQPWIFIWRTGAEAEALILWPPDEKSQLIAKDPDAGKDWGQKEKEVQRMRWLAPPTQWSWIWANTRRQWRTEEPGEWQPLQSQWVKHDLFTKQQPRLSKDIR